MYVYKYKLFNVSWLKRIAYIYNIQLMKRKPQAINVSNNKESFQYIINV